MLFERVELTSFTPDTMPNSKGAAVAGVRFDKKSGKWRAEISLRGKSVQLGRTADHEEAILLRLRAETDKKVGTLGVGPNGGRDPEPDRVTRAAPRAESTAAGGASVIGSSSLLPLPPPQPPAPPAWAVSLPPPVLVPPPPLPAGSTGAPAPLVPPPPVAW